MKKSDLKFYIDHYNNNKGLFRWLIVNHPQMVKLMKIYSNLKSVEDNEDLSEITINAIKKIIANTIGSSLTTDIMTSIAKQLENEEGNKKILMAAKKHDSKREAKKKFHMENRHLFAYILRGNDSAGLEKWLEENPNLDSREQARVLQLLKEAIESPPKDILKHHLIYTLLHTSHKQVQDLILNQYGPAILGMLIKHKRDILANNLMALGVNPIKPYDANHVKLIYEDGKKPFQEFHGICGLSVAAAMGDEKLLTTMVKLADKMPNINPEHTPKKLREITQVKTAAFHQALSACQPACAEILQKYVDYDLKNIKGERAINLALKGLANYCTDFSATSDRDYFAKIFKSLELVKTCLENTPSFPLKNSMDREDLARFLFAMLDVFIDYRSLNNSAIMDSLTLQFASVLTEFIRAQAVSLNTLFTPPQARASLSLAQLLDNTSGVLVYHINRALSSQQSIGQSHRLFSLDPQPSKTGTKSILKKASSFEKSQLSTREETSPQARVSFEL